MFWSRKSKIGFSTPESLNFYGNFAGDLAPPPGCSLLPPARQVRTPLRPAPLPLTWRRLTASALDPCAPGARSPESPPTKEVYTEGPKISLSPARGQRWGLLFRRAKHSSSKEAFFTGPYGNLLPARGLRWGLNGGRQILDCLPQAGPEWARADIFTKRNRGSFYRAPAAAPCGSGTFLWGPRYKFSCGSALHRAPHPAGAKARRVYKRVGRKTAKLRTAAAAQKFRVKSNFLPRRIGLPCSLSCTPVNGGLGGRRLKTPRRSRMFSPPSTPSDSLVTF